MATHGMVRCLHLYLVQLAVGSVTKMDKMRTGSQTTFGQRL
jgi:hypothetical protein